MAKSKRADWEFVFDGVFGFLSSPLWSVPMMSFIDTQCVVFEPSEENHLEWTAIHNKYRALVESLLTGYLQDVGITEQEFMKACTSPSVQRSVEMQSICEQLFAGEDFEIFKKMMIQRNVELELEALKLIQKRQGKKRDSIFNSSYIPTEEEIIQEVIRRSEEEYKEYQKKKSVESEEYNETIEKMITASSTESERLEQDVVSKQEETKRVVQESIERDNDTAAPVEKVSEGEGISQEHIQPTETEECVPDVQKHTPSTKTEECIPDVVQKPTPSTKAEESVPDVAQKNTPPTKTEDGVSAPNKSHSKSSPRVQATELSSRDNGNKSSNKPSSQSPTKSPPFSPIKCPTEKQKLPDIKRDPTSSEAADQWLQSAKDENTTSSTCSRGQRNANLSDVDIKKREEYLKQQRDRIQKMKNEEREKQLLTYTKSTPQRPVSARVAKDAVSGEAKMTADEKKQLAMRRVLAEKLKKEVIYKDVI